MAGKEDFGKLVKAGLFGIGGLLFGYIIGSIFAQIGIAPYIPWEDVITFLGGLGGFSLGLEY